MSGKCGTLAVGQKFMANESSQTSNIIGAAEAGTLPGLFLERIRRTPQSIAYRDYDRAQEIWRDHTWQAMGARAACFQAALRPLDLAPGERVAILSPNGINWVACDMAAQGLGLVVVPLYAHDSAANSAYILGHTGAKLALIDTAERWQELSAHASQFPALQDVWLGEGAVPPSGSTAHPRIGMMDAVVPRQGGAFDVAAAEPKAAATIIYTSGTTGRPKGVVLSHFALLWNAEAVTRLVPPRENDLFLSVLPLAHAFERTIGYYLPIMGGSMVVYARSVQELRADLLSVRPTALLAVPRLFERIHATVLSRAEKSRLRNRLLDLTVSLGWRRFKFRQGRGPALGMMEAIAWRVLDRLVAAQVRAAFGGRLRVAVSGGATLPQNVARFLIGLGIPVVEGYGLSEAAPVVSTNSVEDNLPGSVGRALPGVDVKLAANGELLVRSPAVMSGYWKDELATVNTFDKDGWLKTGDVAEFKDGRVFIRGRLKEIIVLSTGENVNPVMLETGLEKDTLIRQAMVVGDDRPFVAAVLVLDEENWKALAAANGMDPSLPNAEPARAMIEARVNQRLSDMPRYAQVRAVHATLDPWTVDRGHLTPTLKIKRRVVQGEFAAAIEALYARRTPHL